MESKGEGNDDVIERKRIFRISAKEYDDNEDKKYRVYEYILEKWLCRLFFVNVFFLMIFAFLFFYK